MKGSHWCATYAKDNVINYFDSFGMMPFQELVDLLESRKERECNLIASESAITKPLYIDMRLLLFVFLK